jgi:hypothetical protein
MRDSLSFWAGYILIVGLIVTIGWNQPLRYRFMTGEEIYALEHPATPEPVIKKDEENRGNWMWEQNRRTSLDSNRRKGSQ